MIKDTGDKISSSDRQAIESAMEAVKQAIAGTDGKAIQNALDQLTQAQHKAAEALYRSQAAGASGASGGGDAGPSAGGGASSGASGGEAKGDVIDAEVVDEGKSS